MTTARACCPAAELCPPTNTKRSPSGWKSQFVNVVAVLPGSDPSLRDEYVIIVERDGERLRLNITLGELR